MDPLSAIGLAASCLQLGSAVISTANAMHYVSEHLDMSKDIELLASQLNLIGFAITQL
jgi:hypothetical protein